MIHGVNMISYFMKHYLLIYMLMYYFFFILNTLSFHTRTHPNIPNFTLSFSPCFFDGPLTAREQRMSLTSVASFLNLNISSSFKMLKMFSLHLY